MTNAIGKHTCNLPVNMDTDERAAWGRVAFEENKSVGQLFREMALEWARQNRPDIAKRVAMIRSHRSEIIRTGAATFLLAIGLLSAWQSMQPNTDEQQYARAKTYRVWRARKLKDETTEA